MVVSSLGCYRWSLSEIPRDSSPSTPRHLFQRERRGLDRANIPCPTSQHPVLPDPDGGILSVIGI